MLADWMRAFKRIVQQAWSSHIHILKWSTNQTAKRRRQSWRPSRDPSDTSVWPKPHSVLLLHCAIRQQLWRVCVRLGMQSVSSEYRTEPILRVVVSFLLENGKAIDLLLFLLSLSLGQLPTRMASSESSQHPGLSDLHSLFLDNHRFNEIFVYVSYSPCSASTCISPLIHSSSFVASNRVHVWCHGMLVSEGISWTPLHGIACVAKNFKVSQ